MFSSPYLKPLRTYLKIITKVANPDFQIRKYSLIYELYMLGVTDKASSLITDNFPQFTSPSLPLYGSEPLLRWDHDNIAWLTLAVRQLTLASVPQTGQGPPTSSCIHWHDVLLNSNLQPARQTPGSTPLIRPVQTFVCLLRIILHILEDIRVHVVPNPKWKMTSGLRATNWKGLITSHTWGSLIRIIHFPPSLSLLLDLTFCFKVSKSKV